jgi:hypothetical protein
MKTIHATLAAMQKAPSAAAIARASLADSGRLHPERLFSGAYTGGSTIGVSCGTFYVRFRYRAGGFNDLQVQKISDPSAESQWQAWSSFVSGVLSGETAVFWTGTYAVVVWQDSATAQLRYSRSADGVSWSSPAVAYTPGAVAAMAGVSGGSARSGIVLGYNGQVYWGAYNPDADAWSTASAAGISASSVASVAGFHDSANARHVFLFTAAGFVAWGRFCLVVITRSDAGSWSSGLVLFNSDPLGINRLSASQAQIGGRWWLSLHRLKNWGSTEHTILSSAGGIAWEDSLFTDITAEPLLCFFPPLAGSNVTYLATERYVYRSSPQAYWSNVPVVRYEFATGAAAWRVSGGRHPHMLATVEQTGALALPEPGSVLTLERGYHISGSDFYVPAGTYYVAGFRYNSQDRLLHIRAFDALGALTSWVADTAFTWRAQSVETIARQLCGLAGVQPVTFDASPMWDHTIASFTHPAGETGRLTLHGLAERVPFEYTVRQDGTLHFYVPAASPPAGYTFGYGAGEHQYWPGEFGSEATPTYATVVGSPPRTSVGEAARQAAMYAAGRRLTERIHDPRVQSGAHAAELAAARLVLHAERARAGSFSAPPCFSLEVGDVVAFSGPRYEATAGPWRVEAFAEYFNVDTPRRFVQHITLRGTA